MGSNDVGIGIGIGKGVVLELMIPPVAQWKSADGGSPGFDPAWPFLYPRNGLFFLFLEKGRLGSVKIVFTYHVR